MKIFQINVVVVICVIMFFLLACGKGETNVNASDGGDTLKVSDLAENLEDKLLEDKTGLSSKKVEDLAAHDKPLLAEGNHAVFGLKMPRGMIPLKAPTKVYRFAGTYSINELKRYLFRQIMVDDKNIEKEQGKNFLARHITIIASSQSDETVKNRYSIRIFDGSLGGASVDIWKEIHVKKRRTKPAKFNVSGNFSNSVKNNKQLPPPKTSRKESIGQTMNVIEKIENGEKLTKEDLQSSYFTDI